MKISKEKRWQSMIVKRWGVWVNFKGDDCKLGLTALYRKHFFPLPCCQLITIAIWDFTLQSKSLWIGIYLNYPSYSPQTPTHYLKGTPSTV